MLDAVHQLHGLVNVPPLVQGGVGVVFLTNPRDDGCLMSVSDHVALNWTLTLLLLLCVNGLVHVELGTVHGVGMFSLEGEIGAITVEVEAIFVALATEPSSSRKEVLTLFFPPSFPLPVVILTGAVFPH